LLIVCISFDAFTGFDQHNPIHPAVKRMLVAPKEARIPALIGMKKSHFSR
jgi:hypothetical protein